MLDKDIFKTGMEELMYLFKGWDFNPTSKAEVETWYRQFKYMDKQRFLFMINSYVKNEKFNPTVRTLLDNDNVHLYRKSKDQIKHEKMLEEQKRTLEQERNQQ